MPPGNARPERNPAWHRFVHVALAAAFCWPHAPTLHAQAADPIGEWKPNWIVNLTRAAASASQPVPIIELRQYTLHPGRRDVLIDLFEREFIESQEALGMKIVGTFRDLDRPDRFVWIRGFADMPSRAEGLNAFYGGPVWQQHRNAANATMVDSDNVLLLRAAGPDSAFPPGNRPRPPHGAVEIPKGLVIC